MQPKACQQIEEKSAELMNTANTTIQRGEQVVRERFLRPLDFVLLATRRDIEQLSLRVIELTAEVHQLATGKAKTAAEPAENDDSADDGQHGLSTEAFSAGRFGQRFSQALPDGRPTISRQPVLLR
jgi:hypothetical protein